MKKLLIPLFALLGTAGALAQTSNGVTVGTDPARAAAVERHAQELQARPAEKATAAPARATKAHRHAQRSHPSKKH